jgi:tetratricopeptide (TPR) repeat protein
LRLEVARDGYEATLTAYQQQAMARAKDTSARVALGVLFFVGGRREQAQSSLEQAVALGAQQRTAFHYLGLLYLEQGDLEKAAAAFRREVAANPEDPRAHFNLGMSLMRHETLRDAIAALKRATELSPTFVEAHVTLANARFLRGEVKESAAALRRCLELDPNNPGAWYQWGQVNVGMGRLEETERAYRRAIALKPDQAEYHHALGVLYLYRPMNAENNAAALNALQRALELDPASGDAYATLGTFYRRQGRLEKAAQALRKAAQLKPEAPNVRYTLAQVLRQLGKEQEAAQHLAQVKTFSWSRRLMFLQRELDFNPDNPQARFELGCFYEQKKEHDKAERQFRALARLEPQGARAHEHLARVYTELGDPRRAAQEKALAAKLSRKR